MSQKHKVVVIGGGFGGLTLVKKLAYEPVEVLLIDRSNHHLFQPLLYQVATGGLSPANIAMPLRTLVRYQSNCKSILGEVASVDVKKQEVVLTDGDRFGFDTLVVAAGAVTSYFNHPEWADNSVGLKSLDDAMKIRGRILRSFERAERSTDVQEQARLLTFVVVGGGPTGVEMAGAIAELAHHSMRNEFRNIKPESARVILVEGQSRPLTMFREDLSAQACKDLERLGVELRMGVQVKAVSADEVELSTGEKLSTNTVIWAAGVSGNPLGAAISQSTGIALERGQRIPVGADCSVSGHPNIFVIGDLAAFTPQGETQTLPGVAPVATQQAQYVGKLIHNRLNGNPAPPPFSYFDKGSMATIGRGRAIAQVKGFGMKGFLAWMAWLFIHVLLLIGFQNRLLVLAQLAVNFVTQNRGARVMGRNDSWKA
ncbi:MAG: FAD-dependent oxidoreductase [Planctomycetaceae bacterium]|nr:NAD(P)/FAD-dependent oxidoreductase [Gemmataceae bacterium]PHX62602.1 MAG: FAD-dependent oxidoreductase [Planctomycetaceae bacterium]